jgi:hypothetical protein
MVTRVLCAIFITYGTVSVAMEQYGQESLERGLVKTQIDAWEHTLYNSIQVPEEEILISEINQQLVERTLKYVSVEHVRRCGKSFAVEQAMHRAYSQSDTQSAALLKSLREEYKQDLFDFINFPSLRALTQGWKWLLVALRTWEQPREYAYI